MYRKSLRRHLLALTVSLSLGSAATHAVPMLVFEEVWAETGAGAEIVAIDATNNRVFSTTGDGVEVRALEDDGSYTKGELIGTFSIPNGGVNSVAVKNGIVAIAAAAQIVTNDGTVTFFDAGADPNGASPLDTVAVGALPDMLTFTPDGSKVLVANEGEPNDDYTTDPEGSVSVIDIDTSGSFSATVTHLDFNAFDSEKSAIENEGGRIFGPGASVSRDLEPEYIAVSPDGTQAFVTLQENNAVAIIDLDTNTVTDVQGLGFKDHSLPGNELDASDRDNTDGNLQNWPVFGMYQPDSIVSYTVAGETYYVTANEGDAREYEGTPGFVEEERVKDIQLDLNDDGIADTFSPLQDDEQLGRLNVTDTIGDTDGDGLFEQLYAFGARSMSIWDDQGMLVGDTGSTIEQMIRDMFPDQWEDGRSDNKGPEPEALEVVVLNGVPYALLGLERTDGFMVFDISNPTNPVYLDYIFNDRDEAPEGIDFALMAPIPSQGLYNDWGYVAVANEDSNTTVLYRVSQVPEASTLALLGLGLGLVSLRRRTQSKA